MEKYIDTLRSIKEQSGIEVNHFVLLSWTIWLILTPFAIWLAAFIIIAITEIDVSEMIMAWSAVVLSILTVIGLLAWYTRDDLNSQQKSDVLSVVEQMSTDDYVDLQKQVQLYGKKDIQKDDLRAISKLLRNEFFSRTSEHFLCTDEFSLVSNDDIILN